MKGTWSAKGNSRRRLATPIPLTREAVEEEVELEESGGDDLQDALREDGGDGVGVCVNVGDLEVGDSLFNKYYKHNTVIPLPKRSRKRRGIINSDSGEVLILNY